MNKIQEIIDILVTNKTDYKDIDFDETGVEQRLKRLFVLMAKEFNYNYKVVKINGKTKRILVLDILK